MAEVDRILGLRDLLEAGIGQVKQRNRGASGAQVLYALACAQLAGEDHLVGLDRRRVDAAGQELAPVPDVPSTTAAQIAMRCTPASLWGLEEAVGTACGRLLDQLDPADRGRLLRTVTLDQDCTDIEVYGPKKQGATHGHKGARQLRVDLVSWAELGVPLAADLLEGTEDPRAGMVDRLLRSINALPDGVEEIRARFDTGYFAVDLAEACVDLGIGFAIGVRRTAPVFAAARAVPEHEWVDATGMAGTQVAAIGYLPRTWAKNEVIATATRRRRAPERIGAIARRTRYRLEDLPTAKARKRRALDPDQLTLALDGDLDYVYGYSFVLTNLDIDTAADLAAVEHWYRHRTDIEAINRDAKHGAALRHLPSGDKTVNAVWAWAALLACAISSFIHYLTKTTTDQPRWTIPTLRRELIAIPARVRRARDGTLWLHPPPGQRDQLSSLLARLQHHHAHAA